MARVGVFILGFIAFGARGDIQLVSTPGGAKVDEVYFKAGKPTQAAKWVGDAGTDSVVETLGNFLRDPDYYKREAAVAALKAAVLGEPRPDTFASLERFEKDRKELAEKRPKPERDEILAETATRKQELVKFLHEVYRAGAGERGSWAGLPSSTSPQVKEDLKLYHLLSRLVRTVSGEFSPEVVRRGIEVLSYADAQRERKSPTDWYDIACRVLSSVRQAPEAKKAAGALNELVGALASNEEPLAALHAFDEARGALVGNSEPTDKEKASLVKKYNDAVAAVKAATLGVGNATGFPKWDETTPLDSMFEVALKGLSFEFWPSGEFKSFPVSLMWGRVSLRVPNLAWAEDLGAKELKLPLGLDPQFTGAQIVLPDAAFKATLPRKPLGKKNRTLFGEVVEEFSYDRDPNSTRSFSDPIVTYLAKLFPDREPTIRQKLTEADGKPETRHGLSPCLFSTTGLSFSKPGEPAAPPKKDGAPMKAPAIATMGH